MPRKSGLSTVEFFRQIGLVGIWETIGEKRKALEIAKRMVHMGLLTHTLAWLLFSQTETLGRAFTSP